MSWDIYIQDLPEVATAAEIPDHFRPGPIGHRTELLAQLRDLLPMAEFQEEHWCFVTTPEIDLSIGISAEADGSVTHIVVHVHGGEGSPECVARVVRGLGLRALDTALGEFFDPDSPEAGYLAWRNFKDGLAR